MSITEKVKKESGRRGLKYAVSAAFCLIAIVFFVYHIVNELKPGVSFTPATRVTLDDTSMFTGYIFGSFDVLSSPGGAVFCEYSDSEKLPANAVAAQVWSADNKSAEKRLADISERISVLSESGSASPSALSSRIEALYVSIMQKNNSGDYAGANALSRKLLVLLSEKALAEETYTDYSAEILALESEAAAIKASLGISPVSVVSPSSGVFFRYCDGYEKSFTSEAAVNLDIQGYKSLVSSSPADYNAVGSVMTDFKWYYASLTDISGAAGFEASSYYDASFIDNTHTGKLRLYLEDKQTDHASGEVLLVFSCSSVPGDLDITRCQRAEIVRSDVTGLSVPSECVRVSDGETCVYVFDSGFARLRKVEVLLERDGVYIVSESDADGYLALNDLVITNRKNLYDGKLLK